jgi:hypothetical protein
VLDEYIQREQKQSTARLGAALSAAVCKTPPNSKPKRRDSGKLQQLREAVGQIIVGQQRVVDGALTAIIAEETFSSKAFRDWERRSSSKPGPRTRPGIPSYQFTPTLMPATSSAPT